MANREAKRKDKTLIGIDQRMVNQRGFSRMEIGAMSSEMIEENRDVLDVTKRAISKGIAWQKISICTMRRRTMKILI